MPWPCRKKRAQAEKPPDYSLITHSLTAAAEKSLLSALSEFRKHNRYQRNPINGTWQVSPGALVTLMSVNLGTLNKSLAKMPIRADMVDWYSEMVVEHGIAYNHPKLIHVLFGIDF